ncbi:MAG: MFS transporter [Alphaproteobacteria bacterium]|nr:MFS transporter [Alphaproteobacteria bacterium]
MSLASYRRDGWPLVAALSVAQLVSWGTIFYGFPLFIASMESELGWSRSLLNGALSLGLLTAGFAAYPIGRIIDVHGGRLVMSLGSLLAVLLFVAWAYMRDPILFYAIWFGLGIAQACTLYTPVFAVLTRLFPDSAKIRITMLTLTGGFASTVFTPLIAWWIESLGWQTALLLMAACNLVFCLPVHALLLRDRARPQADAPVQLSDKTPMQRALRNPVFWGLAVCFTFYLLAHAMLIFHFLPMLAEYGVALATAVAIITVIGPAQVGGRILLLFGRKIETVATGYIVMSLFVLAMLLLVFFPSVVPVLFIMAGVYGMANGMMTILRGTSVPELLGREGFGAISGALTLPASIAAAIAPSLAALIWDVTGGYAAVILAMLLAMLTSAAGFVFAVKARK